MKTIGLLLGAVVLFSCAGLLRAANPVIVHEWGTFTCLQDEHGNAIGGINVDDEPVPAFVFNVAGAFVTAQYSAAQQSFGLPPYSSALMKGGPLPACDSNVTMRLETPVLYIYPPKGQAAASVLPLDVHVNFHGGILSQFYPYATTNGLPLNGSMPYFQGTLNGDTITGLTWSVIQIGASGKLISSSDPTLAEAPPWFKGQLVETTDKVWTTPRETSAPLLQVHLSMTDNLGKHDVMQTEHFLFYRGVGHLDSPLAIGPTAGTAAGLAAYSLASHCPERFESEGWLTEIRGDGTCALVELPAISVPEKAAFILKGGDKEGDFTEGNLAKLKTSMHRALVKAGLYDDEATAMLKTWELSYFKSPGLRFFYIVPRKWVDQVLPLKVTGAPAEITRVMVGRIELITDQQKATLAHLASGAYPDIASFRKAASAALAHGKFSAQERQEFCSGARPLRDLGMPIPAAVSEYLSLGRFRDALIVHEQQTHPSDNLARFIQANGLAAR